MDSMNTYKMKETQDACLLYQRIEDLERDVDILKELVNGLVKEVDLQTEYVKLCTYRRDIQLLRDEQTILQKDMDKLTRDTNDTKTTTSKYPLH